MIIMVSGSREKITELMSEIMSRAEKGDMLFGQDRTCTGYPQKFFTSISTAVERGVKFQAIIVEKPESRDFINFLLGLDPRYVEVRKSKSEIYSTVFGIRGKEVLICYHMINRSIKMHLRNPLTTKYIEEAFDKIWKEAERIKVERK